MRRNKEASPLVILWWGVLPCSAPVGADALVRHGLPVCRAWCVVRRADVELHNLATSQVPCCWSSAPTKSSAHKKLGVMRLCARPRAAASPSRGLYLPPAPRPGAQNTSDPTKGLKCVRCCRSPSRFSLKGAVGLQLGTRDGGAKCQVQSGPDGSPLL
jgi:hypothetical protein